MRSTSDSVKGMGIGLLICLLILAPVSALRAGGYGRTFYRSYPVSYSSCSSYSTYSAPTYQAPVSYVKEYQQPLAFFLYPFAVPTYSGVYNPYVAAAPHQVQPQTVPQPTPQASAADKAKDELIVTGFKTINEQLRLMGDRYDLLLGRLDRLERGPMSYPRGTQTDPRFDPQHDPRRDPRQDMDDPSRPKAPAPTPPVAPKAPVPPQDTMPPANGGQGGQGGNGETGRDPTESRFLAQNKMWCAACHSASNSKEESGGFTILTASGQLAQFTPEQVGNIIKYVLNGKMPKTKPGLARMSTDARLEYLRSMSE